MKCYWWFLNGNIIWVFAGSLMPIYIILTVVYVCNLVNEGNNTSRLLPAQSYKFVNQYKRRKRYGIEGI